MADLIDDMPGENDIGDHEDHGDIRVKKLNNLPEDIPAPDQTGDRNDVLIQTRIPVDTINTKKFRTKIRSHPTTAKAGAVTNVVDVSMTTYGKTKQINPLLTGAQKKELRNLEKEIIEEIPEAIIISMQMTLLSTEDIETHSVAKIYKAEPKSIHGSVNDPRLGVNAETNVCETCKSEKDRCPGHLGHIDLASSIYHPSYINYVAMILNCVCSHCGNLKLTKDQLEAYGILRASAINRLKRVEDLCLKFPEDISCCKKGKDESKDKTPCKISPEYSVNKDTKQIISNIPKEKDGKAKPSKIKKKDSNSHIIFPDEAFKILDCITDEDSKLLGFPRDSHPRSMIMYKWPVAPPSIRRDNKVDGIVRSSSMTESYRKIVQVNNNLMDILTGQVPKPTKTDKKQKTADELQKDLYLLISALIDETDGKNAPGKNKVFATIKQMIQGKDSLIRGASMGKRVNFTARTVISPDPTLKFGQIRIPKAIAKTLTRRVTINSYNLAAMKKLLNPDDPNEEPRIVRIFPSSGNYKGNILSNIPRIRQNYELKIGDEVDRWLQNGDQVVFNRQPTLHKQSMMGYSVVIGEENTIGLHLSSSTAHNFDFDGDESVIHALQSLDAIMEAMSVASVQSCIMNPQTNRPIIGAVYDTLSGSLLMTQEGVEINPADMIEYLSIMTSKEQLESMPARLRKHGVNPSSGRALFSALLPPDLQYQKEGVIIRDGILTKGVITSAHIGMGHNSLVQVLWRTYGSNRVCDFLTDLPWVVNEWFATYGFSVGLADCLPGDPENARLLQNEISKSRMGVRALGPVPEDPYEREQYELQVVAKLRNVKNVGDQIIRERLATKSELEDLLRKARASLKEAPTENEKKRIEEKIETLNKYLDKWAKDPRINPLRVMAKSGAKGDEFNVTQIMALLGQQFLKGERFKPEMTNKTRVMPYYDPNSNEIESRGFIIHGLTEGLSPAEVVFYQAAGRKSLTDSAITTADTGAMHHTTVKALESIVVAHDGSVRNAAGVIYQMTYGDDGFDAAELQNVSYNGDLIPSFIDLGHEIANINAMFGFY